LRIRDALVIWPYGYSYRIDGKDIWIIDDKGIHVVRVGDKIELGGGYVPDYAIEQATGQPLNGECRGKEKYWLTGNVVKETET
jgi:hypothetical protein